MKTILICDIETNGLLDEVTTVHSLILRDLNTDEVQIFVDGEIEEAIRIMNEADQLIFHNGIGYDVPVLNKLYPNHPLTTEVIDTLVMSKVLNSDLPTSDMNKRYYPQLLEEKCSGSHSLKAWGIRLGEFKGDYDGGWESWNIEMENYCIQDTLVTQKLFRHFSKQDLTADWFKLEHKFARVCQNVMDTGVTFDVALAEKSVIEWEATIERLTKELAELFPSEFETTKTPSYYFVNIEGQRYEMEGKGKLTDHIVSLKLPGATRKWLKDNIKRGPFKKKENPFNPRSGQQVASRLIEKYKWEPIEFTPTGIPLTSGDVLRKLEYPGAQLLADYKEIIKIYDMIKGGDQSWLNQVKEDGKIYGNINHNGAVTGRCTHSKPNLGQIPSKSNPLGPHCRGMFIPSKGMKMVGWDASSLEMRCLAHYLHRFDNGAYADIVCNGDPHTFNQKAAGLPTRDMAKTFFYALIYGAGDAKIGSIVDGSEYEGKRLKEKFFRAIPAFDSFLKLVKKVYKENGFLKGLDGRPLPIRSNHAILNTLLQSAGAVLMKKAAVLQDEDLSKNYKRGEDYNLILLVHDEIQSEIRNELVDEMRPKLSKYLSQAGQLFDFKCELPADVSEPGNSWRDTH